MKFEIIEILDRGDKANERLHLRMLADGNIQYIVVFAAKYTKSNSVNLPPKHTHWFRSKLVKTGDSLVLYTRAGSPSEITNTNGTISHFEFWGLSNPAWSQSEDCAMVLELNTWQTTPPSNKK
jgi:hypothetical protein